MKNSFIITTVSKSQWLLHYIYAEGRVSESKTSNFLEGEDQGFLSLLTPRRNGSVQGNNFSRSLHSLSNFSHIQVLSKQPPHAAIPPPMGCGTDPTRPSSQCPALPVEEFLFHSTRLLLYNPFFFFYSSLSFSLRAHATALDRSWLCLATHIASITRTKPRLL